MHLVSIAGGDTNLSATQRQAVAKASGATLVEGHGVDCLFVDGARPVETHVLAKGGSDHPAIIYVLEAQGRRIVVLQWNVYVGQRPVRARRRLARLIKRWNPDVILLSEAYRCRDQLARLKGYHLIQGANVGEGADCALMFRADHHLKHAGTARMRRTWIGPKHRLPKQPRHYPRGRVELAPDLDLRAVSLHLPTTDRAGHNTAAVDESIARVTRWLKRG